jgi:AcrR family transcriptional regulator
MIIQKGISGAIMKKQSRQDLTTREKIINSTLTVITNKKVSGMRLRDVARQAGVSLGTIHYHFPTKSALLVDVLGYMKQCFDEDRQREFSWDILDPDQKLWSFMTQEQKLLLEEPDREMVFLDFWGQASINPQIQQKIRLVYNTWRKEAEEVIEEGIKRGNFTSIDKRLISYIVIALLEGFAVQFLIDPEASDIEEFFLVSYRMILRILTDPRFWSDTKSAKVPSSEGSQ